MELLAHPGTLHRDKAVFRQNGIRLVLEHGEMRSIRKLIRDEKRLLSNNFTVRWADIIVQMLDKAESEMKFIRYLTPLGNKV